MPTAVDAQALGDFTASQLPAALDLLRTLVGVNSFTANRAGVLENARLIAEAFAPLGFAAETVRSEHERYGDHLFLTRGGGDGPMVALVSHLDTVFPPEEEAAHDFHWRVEGDRVYGPGVNDIKGGTAMMWLVLQALRRFVPDLFERTRWLVALNASEEADSTQFAELTRARLAPAAGAIRGVLVFEAAHPVDARTTKLVTRRKGRVAARIECQGRAAHSGVDHDAGANAAVELARVMGKLAERTDYAAQVTWNVASLTAGIPGVYNRVPHAAVGELEVRAFDRAPLAEAKRLLLGLAGPGEVAAATDGWRCERRVTLVDDDPPWPGGEGTEGLFARWRRAAERVGRRVVPESRGGLSDANPLSATGLPILDGLGPMGLHAHCSQRSADGTATPEWMDIPSFAPLAAMHTLALADLLGGENELD